MFGFSNEYKLKKEIILYLDNQVESVPSQVITEAIGSVTSQTIRKYLLEIKEKIEATYAPENLRLEINRRSGIQLLRQNANFDLLFETIFKESLTYAIFVLLIENRSFDSEEFCATYHISLSNLRRKVKDINRAVKPYDIYLTVGRKVTIYGDESSVRMLFFSFLYDIHHGISTTDLADSATFLKLAEKLCQYLYIEPTPAVLDSLGLWIYINERAIDTAHFLELGVATNQFKIKIACPEFLNKFADRDWQYFLGILISLDFMELSETDNFQAEHENRFSKATTHWIDLFEENFVELTMAQKELVTKTMYQNVLLDDTFCLAGNLITVFESLNSEEMRRLYPAFMNLFDKFWDDFGKVAPEASNEFIKNRSLLLVFKFVPNELLFRQVSVCLLSNLTLLKQDQIKRHLKNQLKNRADLTFVGHSKVADLILLTEAHPEAEKGIILSSTLSEQDIRTVEQALREFIGA